MATTITPQIVNLNTQVTEAPAVSQLQNSGAIVSAGGTTLAAGTYQYCSTLSAAVGILAAPLPITSLSWSSGTVTATVAAMSEQVGQTFRTTISGAVPAGYNGTYEVTVASSTTLTYTLTTNPGSETTPGYYLPPYAAFVQQSATTFFAQGSSVGVYVLELGVETAVSSAITALQTWLTENPGVFYGLLVAPSWDGSQMATMVAQYANPTSKLYFFVTTTSSNLSLYAGTKSVIAAVEAPGTPETEVTAAAFLYQWIVQVPSATAQAQPYQFRQLYGVTAWPVTGQSATVNSILTQFGNIVYTGVEGSLTGNFLFFGRTMDGAQGGFWYAVDWFQIQSKIRLAAAILNGSNSNNPLVYNQQGINSLEAVVQGVANSSIAFGLNLTAVPQATPFATYVAQNPSNYQAGIYGGLQVTVTPQVGFLSITFNIDAVQFA